MTISTIDRPESAQVAPPSIQPQVSARDVARCLDAVNALVAILGPSGDVEWANAAFARAHGRPRARVLGALPHDLYQGDRLRELESVFRTTRESGKGLQFRDLRDGQAFEFIVRAIDGSRVLIVGNPIAATPDEADIPQQECERTELKSVSWGRLDKLSKREREVLVLLGSGMTIKQIAEKLGRSEKTIEGHRDSIYRKIAVNNRAELAMLAIRAGLIPAAVKKDVSA